jgi:glutaredoxin 3
MKERARNVRIYSHPSCPWCRRIKKVLENQGIPYQERNVALDLSAMQEWIEKTERMEVPLVEIDGDLIVGFDREKLREKLGLSTFFDF